MIKLFSNFMSCEDGAVTVDWVVLTAAGIALALGVVGLNNATFSIGGKISKSLYTMTVATY